MTTPFSFSVPSTGLVLSVDLDKRQVRVATLADGTVCDYDEIPRDIRATLVCTVLAALIPLNPVPTAHYAIPEGEPH